MSEGRRIVALAGVNLLFGGLLVGLGWQLAVTVDALRALTRPEETELLLVSFRELYAGTTIREEDLYAVEAPLDLYPGDHYDDPSMLVGHKALRRVRPNMFLGPADVVPTLPAPLSEAVAGGDRLLRVEVPAFITADEAAPRVDLALVPGDCRVAGDLVVMLLDDGTTAVRVPRDDIGAVMDASSRGRLQPMPTGSAGADVASCAPARTDP